MKLSFLILAEKNLEQLGKTRSKMATLEQQEEQSEEMGMTQGGQRRGKVKTQELPDCLVRYIYYIYCEGVRDVYYIL